MEAFGAAAAIAAGLSLAAGGFVKGVVGFALPLVALSAMGSFLPVEVAVALMILPMLVSNLFQSLRNGSALAWGSFRKYWRLNLGLMAMLAVSAQLVVALSDRLLFVIIGGAITAFGLSQLAGWTLRFNQAHRNLVEACVAVVGGFFGGLSGIWGPPVVMYLLAANVPKVEMVRVQSLSFLLGSLVLLAAHVRSGVLNAVTLPMSLWLVAPTMAAMFLGYRLHDRLDADLFRTATLAVLVLAGLNMLRRAALA